MTKRTVRTLYVIISVLMSSAAYAKDDRKFIIDPSNTSILGVTVSSNESEVVGILGKPIQLKESYSDALDTNFRYLYYDGIEIHFGNGDMWGLSCKETKCATNFGVKIGSEKSMVIKMYGEGNKSYDSATRDSLRYPFKSCDCFLVFYFENDKVIEISYFFDYA